MLGKLAYSVFNSQFLFICGFIWGSFRFKNVKMNILNIIKLAEILNLNALSEWSDNLNFYLLYQTSWMNG